MRDWKQLNDSNIMRDLIEYFNQNSDSSAFIDSMVGTILSNGVIYNGRETVDGMLIRPLKPVEITGIVNSATVFDNFDLYFRDTNKIVSLSMFPIDFLSYANGKLNFLYIREDLSYRISEYMFGEADEVLLARFCINTDSTWNHMYIMAQRAGTPMYNAGDEFYDVEGMYVKSPGGLELSQTSGTTKRSGIDFTDKVSPDIYQFYNLASERVPLRYINNFNEIDYTQAKTYNLITDRYMTYNMSKQDKIKAEEYIHSIRNLFYLIDNYANATANELHDMIVNGAENSDLLQVTNAYANRLQDIYAEVEKLYALLGNDNLKEVRRAGLQANMTLVSDFIARNILVASVTEAQVLAIRKSPAFIIYIDPVTCANPLEMELQNVQDELAALTFNAGTINSVPNGKFTIQRVLWDIYEQSLVLQYGDTIYDTFNKAIEGTGLLAYPAPFGKTIFIPLAIIVLKSGITDLNADVESIIIDRRWIEVDQENTGYADYVARAQAEKSLKQSTDLINGVIPAGKADSLKCTITNDGTTNIEYKDGDYYLTYDNLNGRVVLVNDLKSSTYNNKQALSAHQGFVLDQNKFDKAGGQISGHVLPSKTDSYALGSSNNRWSYVYANALNVSGAASVGSLSVGGDLSISGNLSNSKGRYVYSTSSSVYDLRAMAKSTADGTQNIGARTVIVCWKD